MEEFLPDLPFDDPPPMDGGISEDVDENDDEEDDPDDLPTEPAPQQAHAQGKQAESAAVNPSASTPNINEPDAAAAAPYQAGPADQPDVYGGPQIDLVPPDMGDYDDPVFEHDPAPSVSYAAPAVDTVRASQPQTMARQARVNVEVQEHPETPARYVMYRPTLTQPDPLPQPDQKPRCITITLTSTGNKNQDVLRLKRLHDILVSRPGRDKFAFRVRENGFLFEINFPNFTTGLTEPLINKLENLLGSSNIEIMYLV
jgi:hypothetical protein